MRARVCVRVVFALLKKFYNKFDVTFEHANECVNPMRYRMIIAVILDVFNYYYYRLYARGLKKKKKYTYADYERGFRFRNDTRR